jgi:hypothetical protein
MTDQIIDIEAQEVIESPDPWISPETPEIDPKTSRLNIKIKEKEMKKIVKKYNRYRKSNLFEIRRLDGAPQYDNPFSS